MITNGFSDTLITPRLTSHKNKTKQKLQMISHTFFSEKKFFVRVDMSDDYILKIYLKLFLLIQIYEKETHMIGISKD